MHWTQRRDRYFCPVVVSNCQQCAWLAGGRVCPRALLNKALGKVSWLMHYNTKHKHCRKILIIISSFSLYIIYKY